MKYYVKLVAGSVLLVGGVLLLCLAIYKLLHIGTCASGGPYQIARQCPSGVGWWIGSIWGAVIGGLVGAFLLATRGDRPNKPAGAPQSWLESIGVGILSWSLLFTAIGATSLWAVFGPGASDAPGAKLGGGIVGFLFLPMGLIPLVWSVKNAAEDRRLQRTAGPRPPQPQGAGIAGLYQSANLLTSRGAGIAANPRQPSKEETDAIRLAGLPGTATVAAFKYLGKSAGQATLVELQLDVHADGGEPYRLVRQEMFPLAETKRLKVGAEFPVRISREDPSQLYVEWFRE